LKKFFALAVNVNVLYSKQILRSSSEKSEKDLNTTKLEMHLSILDHEARNG
jgi:hypothetical protein